MRWLLTYLTGMLGEAGGVSVGRGAISQKYLEIFIFQHVLTKLSYHSWIFITFFSNNKLDVLIIAILKVKDPDPFASVLLFSRIRIRFRKN